MSSVILICSRADVYFNKDKCSLSVPACPFSAFVLCRVKCFWVSVFPSSIVMCFLQNEHQDFFFTCLYNNGKQLEFLRRFPDLFILPANRINSLVRPCRLSVFSFTPKILQCLQLWREHNVPIFRHFKLSIHNYMDCNQFIQAFIFSLFHPLSCFFFFLDRAAGCIVSSQCLASPHVQTFFGNYKQPSQPREAFADSFTFCINIYQARKHRQMSTMRRFHRVARWWAHSCSGLKCNPSIRFVVLKHFVQLQKGGDPNSLAAAELVNSLIANINVQLH